MCHAQSFVRHAGGGGKVINITDIPKTDPPRTGNGKATRLDHKMGVTIRGATFVKHENDFPGNTKHVVTFTIQDDAGNTVLVKAFLEKEDVLNAIAHDEKAAGRNPELHPLLALNNAVADMVVGAKYDFICVDGCYGDQYDPAPHIRLDKDSKIVRV